MYYLYRLHYFTGKEPLHFMKRICTPHGLLCLLLLFYLACLILPAQPPDYPYMKGLLTDNRFNVYSVNLYGPAYEAGVRPGDQLEDTTLREIDRLSPYRSTVRIDRNGRKLLAFIEPRQLRLSSEQTTFLVMPSALDFAQAERRLAEDKALRLLTPVVKSSPGYNAIHTEAEISRHDFNCRPFILGSIPEHIRILTDIFFTPADHNYYTIVHVESHFLGQDGDEWKELPSSGFFPTFVLQRLADK